MSVRKSSAYRISMIVLALVCLAGAGGIVYFTYFAKPSADVLLVKARQRYDDGQAAEKAGKPADAATAYAEAAVHAENGLNAVQERINKGALSKEDGRKLQGELWLLRARATRDRDYAKGAADGKPQEESFDTTLNEKYRSYGVLRDDKDRGTSVADLRNAFDANPADADLAKELLRVELTISPIDWQEVAKVCKTIVQKTPNDPRANYCLAREEFQQGGPRASDKSADRIREAETYLARAADNKSPYWRTTWLRLQILWWYVETAGKKKGKEFDERLADVRKALFEAKVGVLDRAASGEALAPLSPFDSEGLFGVHLFALRALTIDPSKPPEVADVRRVCDSALGMAQKLAESPSKDPHLPQAGAVVSEVLAAATAPLSKGGRSEWELVSAAARAFFEKYPAASSGIAGARVALLTAQEAAAARKRGDPAAKDLQDKAVATLEAGLKTATDQKKPADQLEYRLALLEVKWSDGAKLEEIEAHVAALRGIDLPVAKGVANYYDAHLSMRRGQLEKANKFFEAVLRDKAVPAFALRAHTALAELALTTGEPAAATLHLQQLVNAYSRFNDLPAADRQTLESRFADKDEVVGLQVVATLGAGLKRLERESRTDRERVKEDIVRSAEVLAKTLRVAADKDRPSPDRTARLALAQFRLAVGDRKEAGEALDRLAVDYPRSPEILRARVQFQMLPKAGTTDPEPGARENADRLIERFTRDNPDVRGGKLFWAEWLIRTGRAKEADQYLSSPVHFPDQKDQALNRLRAGALFQSGQREEAMKLLGALPADPTIDWVLLQAASTRDSRDAVLKSALGRYENNGLFRVYEAVTKLADKKFEAAAAELLTVVEYTALRQSARGLLERTFWAYADHDLKAATAYLTRLSADLPDEPAVYAGLATAARLNEDIGTPADTWPAKKTMYAALNKWEQLAVERQGKPGISPLAAGMSRIQFHLLAGNPVAARQDGERLLAQNKGSLDLLYLLTELFLSEPDPQPAKARAYLNAAKELVPPDSVRLLALEVAVREQTNDAAGAAAELERMIVLFPKDSVGYLNRIRRATLDGKPDEAAKWAVKWVEQQPDNDLAVVELIHQYCKTGAKPAAVREADGLVKKVAERAQKQAAAAPADPMNPAEKQVATARALANRAVATAFVRAKAYDEADARMKAALADAPTNPAVRQFAGELALAKEDWDGAVTIYQALFADDNTNGVVANNLAWVLATKKNKPAEALALVEQARTRKGADRPIGGERLLPEFLDTIGVVYTKVANKAKYPDMKELFEGAVRRYPGDARMHFWLAEALAGLGETSNAMARFEVAFQLCQKPIRGLSDDERKALGAQADVKRKKLN